MLKNNLNKKSRYETYYIGAPSGIRIKRKRQSSGGNKVDGDPNTEGLVLGSNDKVVNNVEYIV